MYRLLMQLPTSPTGSEVRMHDSQWRRLLRPLNALWHNHFQHELVINPAETASLPGGVELVSGSLRLHGPLTTAAQRPVASAILDGWSVLITCCGDHPELTEAFLTQWDAVTQVDPETRDPLTQSIAWLVLADVLSQRRLRERLTIEHAPSDLPYALHSRIAWAFSDDQPALSCHTASVNFRTLVSVARPSESDANSLLIGRAFHRLAQAYAAANSDAQTIIARTADALKEALRAAGMTLPCALFVGWNNTWQTVCAGLGAVRLHMRSLDADRIDPGNPLGPGRPSHTVQPVDLSAGDIIALTDQSDPGALHRRLAALSRLSGGAIAQRLASDFGGALLIQQVIPPAYQPRASFEWQFASDLNSLAAFSERLGSVLLPPGASDDYTYWFEEVHLALSEALANVIMHAYQNEPGSIVDLSVAIFSESIEVDMLDDGLPFSAVFPPIPREIDLDNPPEHGFGLHILYQIMEVARYRRIAGTLNHWHFKRSMPDTSARYPGAI